MFVLKKSADRDFVILNLTDIQLKDDAWITGDKNQKITTYTIRELVKKIKPDLITISGDLSYSGNKKAYEALADFMDSFQIPWAPVWGNHDNQGGPEFIERVAEDYLKHPYCLYEKGDSVMGNGNYVIGIEEDGRIVEGIFLMDSHDRIPPYTDEDGNEREIWAKLLPEQLDWYRSQVQTLSEQGCEDTVMIMHLPIYAYRQAFAAAFRKDISRDSVTHEMFERGECWNEGYKDTIGEAYEGIGSYPSEDGVFDVIKELHSTKHVIVGHEHINNWMINYCGVRLIFSLKTGTGSYWRPGLNGGTVIRITSEGVADVYHEYIDISDFITN